MISPDGMYQWDGGEWIPRFELRRPRTTGIHWLIPVVLVALGLVFGYRAQDHQLFGFATSESVGYAMLAFGFFGLAIGYVVGWLIAWRCYSRR